MIWMDYTIEQLGEHFTIKGDWPGEVMGINKDGTKKENYLYKPGDVFLVDEHGILSKTDEVSTLLKKYEASKAQKETM